MRHSHATIAAIVVMALVAAGCAASSAFKRGDSSARLGDWDAAVEHYRRAVQADPENADTYGRNSGEASELLVSIKFELEDRLEPLSGTDAHLVSNALSNLLDAFPDRTELDLYLWIVYHRERLALEERDEKISPQAAKDDILRKGRRRLKLPTPGLSP